MTPTERLVEGGVHVLQTWAGLHGGCVDAAMSCSGNDMTVYIAAASSAHHGSYLWL